MKGLPKKRQEATRSDMKRQEDLEQLRYVITFTLSIQQIRNSQKFAY